MILKVDQGDYNWSSRQREFDQRVNAVSVDAALLCRKTKIAWRSESQTARV